MFSLNKGVEYKTALCRAKVATTLLYRSIVGPNSSLGAREVQYKQPMQIILHAHGRIFHVVSDHEFGYFHLMDCGLQTQALEFCLTNGKD